MNKKINIDFLYQLDLHARKILSEKEYKTWLRLMDKIIVFKKKDDLK